MDDHRTGRSPSYIRIWYVALGAAVVVSEKTFALFQSTAKQLVGKHLPKMLGQPETVLGDPDLYKKVVVEAAWLELPPECRDLGRDTLGWDALFAELYPKTYHGKDGAAAECIE